MEELKDALYRAHATSAGQDEIHYQLIITTFKYFN